MPSDPSIRRIMQEGTVWPEIIDLHDVDRLPSFPLEVLPERVRNMVEAVAVKHAAPIDFVASVALGALASIASRGFSIEPELGWTVPANLYMLAALPVALGKSPVYKALIAELVRIQSEWQIDARPAITMAETDKAIALGAALKAQKDASNGGKDIDVMEARQRARELALAADEICIPALPRIFSNEPTPEAIARICGGNGGALAILSDEGGEVFQLMSRYSGNGMANIGIYLSGYEGSSWTPDRASKDMPAIDRLTLTTVLCIQPSVLGDLGSDKANRERGLLARFLLCIPETHVGERPTVRASIPEHVQHEWNELLRELARQVHDREHTGVICLSKDARHEWQKMLDAAEPRIHPVRGDLRNCSDWGGKAQHHVARLAAVLHLASNPRGDEEVSGETMSNAVQVMNHYAEHVKVAFSMMTESPDQRIAAKVKRWILGRDEPTKEFSQRDAYQGTKGGVVKVTADILPALALLEELGYIAEKGTSDRREPGKAGREKSPIYEVNPSVSTPNTPTIPSNANSGGIGGSSVGVSNAKEDNRVASVTGPDEPDLDDDSKWDELYDRVKNLPDDSDELKALDDLGYLERDDLTVEERDHALRILRDAA